LNSQKPGTHGHHPDKALYRELAVQGCNNNASVAGGFRPVHDEHVAGIDSRPIIESPDTLTKNVPPGASRGARSGPACIHVVVAGEGKPPVSWP